MFVLASLLDGLATTPGMLIVAKVLQGGWRGACWAERAGAGDGTQSCRAGARHVAVHAVSSIGASAGLMLGGVLTEFLSWRWSLLVNVPVGLLVLVLVAIGRLVAETTARPARLDTIGALTATLGSVALV